MARALRLVKIKNPIVREMISEFFGTFILVFLTIGVGCQINLSSGTAGNALSAQLGSGFAVMMGVHVAGKISGAHINPIMSLGTAWVSKFPWWKVPFYMLSQYSAAYVAAALTYLVYRDALFSSGGDPFNLKMASAWASFPSPFVSAWNAFFDALTAGAFLCMLNLAIGDKKNMGVENGVAPLMYGLVVTCIGAGFSFNDGNPMNPARDFGPRLFLLTAGWGTSVLDGPNYSWWWIPLLAPHIGAIVGGTVYTLLIENNYPVEDENETKIEQITDFRLLGDEKMEMELSSKL
ncbi:Aquaporin-10 [Chamberlinius hualienensis]